MKKKLLSILVATTLLLTCIPFGAMSVSAATSGVTGDCTWSLDGTHLTISGNGKMGDHHHDFYNVAPWSGNTITEVTIENGVTSIGKGVFHYLSSLTTVTVGNSVKSIGADAFRYCTSLSAINIPKSVERIEQWAFSNCYALSTTVIGNGSLYLEQGAFNDCPFTDVFYEGTVHDRDNNIVYNDYNHCLFNATWHYADDPIYDDVDHSVMDTANGNGLAFRFELSANGVAKDAGNVVDLSNATVNYLGTDCKLIAMGAVLTNNAEVGATAFTLEDVNNFNVMNIPTVYLQEADEDSCAFAARIINIPDNQLERVIYARPYYIVEVDGEEITVYGEVDSATCAEYL